MPEPRGGQVAPESAEGSATSDCNRVRLGSANCDSKSEISFLQGPSREGGGHSRAGGVCFVVPVDAHQLLSNITQVGAVSEDVSEARVQRLSSTNSSRHVLHLRLCFLAHSAAMAISADIR